MIKNPRLRLAVALLAAASPASARRLLLVRLLGHRIARDARIGRSIVQVDRLTMDSGSSIGHYNLVRHVGHVQLGAGASIGHLNWISGVNESRGYFPGVDRKSALLMAARSAITHRHFIDCCDTVTLGELSLLAGIHSQVLTHGVDVGAGVLMAAPVRIEDRALVCSAAILVAGAVVPSRAVIGAGAVVKGALPDECTLYAGPASVAKRALRPSSGWFVREDAHLY